MTLNIDDSKFLEINKKIEENKNNSNLNQYDSKVSKVSGATEYSFQSDFSEI